MNTLLKYNRSLRQLSQCTLLVNCFPLLKLRQMKKNNFYPIIGLIAVLILSNSCQTESKAARNKFISGKSKVLVCPVHIRDNQTSYYDTISSKKIIDYINGKNYASASFTELCPPANNKWQANEAKILTKSINLLVEYVKMNNLPNETYILYPEFLKAGSTPTVLAIHYCLVNNEGDVVFRGLINSHWDEFKKVNPKTNDDCVAVFINGFEGKIKRE